jgi:cell division protein FtsI/penicillin-binding protein 2
MALGLVGVRVSPMQMAVAYRKLAQQMNEQQKSAVVVRDGMVQSVETGMAHGTHVEGTMLGGKTGTAQDSDGSSDRYWSHGWFAGILFVGQEKAQQVIVIYLPHGNGNDAALLAKRVIEREAGR